MNIQDVKIGVTYKFNNEKFKRENYGCYGISDIDSEILFSKKTLVFTNIKFFYKGALCNDFAQPNCEIGIYIDDFKDYNNTIYDSYHIKLWYVHHDFFEYIEKYISILQVEFEL